MTNQMYSLRWNNHQMNFITIFKKLLEHEELVDVTLSVEGKHIKAHKIILSACSPYFKLLFTMNSNKHPIVILNDVKYNDLKTIIEFMYFGEINIPDERLADILEVAEHLQVRGLYDPKTKNSSDESTIKKKRLRSEHSNVSLNTHHPKNEPNELTSQKNIALDGEMSSATGMHLYSTLMLDDGNGDSHNNRLSGQFQQDVSPQHANGTPNFNVSLHEVDPSTVFQDCSPDVDPYHSLKQALPFVFQGVSTTHSSNSGVGRRRNMKVQESENFQQALEAVRSGSLGFCKAAKLYGLNNRTLWLEYKKRGYPSNRPPVRPVQKPSVPALMTNTS